MSHLGAALELLGELREDAIVGEIDPQEVQWRAEVMLPQVPRGGPIPLLVARPGHWPLEPWRCWTCGVLVRDDAEAQNAGAPTRCSYCAEAARLAIHRVRAR